MYAVSRLRNSMADEMLESHASNNHEEKFQVGRAEPGMEFLTWQAALMIDTCNSVALCNHNIT